MKWSGTSDTGAPRLGFLVGRHCMRRTSLFVLKPPGQDGPVTAPHMERPAWLD